MKKQFFENQFLKHSKNAKETWKTLKLAIRKTSQKNSDFLSINVNGIRITDNKIMANKFNEHFTSMAGLISKKIPPTDRPPDLNAKVANSTFKLKNKPFTNKELLSQLKKLKSKSSLDNFGLSTAFLKEIMPTIVLPILHVFNNSIIEGVVPTQFKKAKVIPIFKGGDPTTVDNFRPISLLSSLSKVLEKLVSGRLTEYLETNNLLTPSQFGFRPGLNTTQPMLHFLNKLTMASNKNEFSIAVFCDLQKAFDCCDHTILLKKLSNLGVGDAELRWFASYLTDRSQYVEINGISSDPLFILCGVPQGSILGPILFLIYINDLPESSKLFSSLFADDTTLLASNSDLNSLVVFVNTELQKVVEYFRANKLLLHPAKTKFLLFHPSLSQIPGSNISLYLNNNNLNDVQNPDLLLKLSHVDHNSNPCAIKFLGTYFDTSLNFNYQIKTLTSKISSSLFLIKSAKKNLSEVSLKSLYYSMIHCHLLYGINIWSCASPSAIKPLVIKQKQAIRIVSASPFNAHTDPIFKQQRILPLKDLIELQRLNFMHNVTFNPLFENFKISWPTNAELNNPNHRNHLDFYIPPAKTSTAKRLPLHTFPSSWNRLDNPSAKSIWKISLFNNIISTTMLNNLPESVICSRLGCPHCH